MKKLILTTLIAIGTTVCVMAQPEEGKPSIAPTPFGAVELLIAAGAALGGKKAWDARRKQQE